MSLSGESAKQKTLLELLSSLNYSKILDWKETVRCTWWSTIAICFTYSCIIVSYIQNKNDIKDEDSITELYKCKPSHHWFYTQCSLVYFMSSFINILLFIAEQWNFWKEKCCGKGNRKDLDTYLEKWH